MNNIVLLLAVAVLAACSAPPARPVSLWDSLPSSESDAAKSAPSKTWSGPTAPGDPAAGPVSTPETADVVGQVVLNEIFYDSAQSDSDGNLFVELYGTPGLSLINCKINFVNGADGGVYDSIKIPAGAKIRDDGFFLIVDAKDGSPTTSNVFGADVIDSFDPQNGPDAVQLVDAQGQLVDAVGYGEGIQPMAQNGLPTFEGNPAIDVASGHSLERREAGVDTNDNSVDFVDREAPTPGSSPVVVTPAPPPPVDPAPPPVVSPPPTPAPQPSPTPAPKVVLNEIYYDAVGSDTDGVLFVELFGTSGMEIGGYKVAFVDGADGSVDDTVVLPTDAHLRADGFYVIADSKNGSTSETGVSGADFVDNFDPANGPDTVQFLDVNGDLMDAVGYGGGVVPVADNGLATFEGSPSIDVLNGHSLERKQPGWDTGDNAADFEDVQTPTPGW